MQLLKRKDFLNCINASPFLSLADTTMRPTVATVATIAIATIARAVSLVSWTNSIPQSAIPNQTPLHSLGESENLEQLVTTYTINEPGENVCRAGSKQWAGSVNVSEGDSLFYCIGCSSSYPQNSTQGIFRI